MSSLLTVHTPVDLPLQQSCILHNGSATGSLIKPHPSGGDRALDVNCSTGWNQKEDTNSFHVLKTKAEVESLRKGDIRSRILNSNNFLSILKNNSLFAQRVLFVTQQPSTQV